MVFAGYGSGRGNGSFWGWLPGAQYDYEREAGQLWKNSIVLPCLKWIETNFPESPLIVRIRNDQGKYETVADHPLVDLIARPNPFYGGDYLWAGTNIDIILDGNAYWRKIRNAAGDVVQIWWVPSWMIQPVRPRDGSVFISHYDYTVNNRTFPIETSEIVHFRDGVDPENDLRGLSRLKAALREVCTDNECATFSAAIMRNMGVPGVVISPEPNSDPNSREKNLTKDQRDELGEVWQEKFNGDRRGEPFIFSRPVRITNPGLSPASLSIDVMRRVPEERISAAIGIPAVVVGLGAGLARSTYANYKEAREAAYESGIMPRQRIYSLALDVQLLPDFDRLSKNARRLRVGFDLSEVRALQDDFNALFTRLELASGGPFLTVNEARAGAGFGKDAAPDSDIIRQPKAITIAPTVADRDRVTTEA